MDHGGSDKKAKGTKKCVIKRRLKFNGYKDCLLNTEIILKSQQRFESDRHDVYTEEINKIALPSRQILVPRTSRGRPSPTSPGRPLTVLFDHPGDVPI